MAQDGNGTRMIIVSNRAPVTFSRESDEREHSRGAGGLVTALNAVSRRREDTVWIASAASDEDACVARESEGEPYEVEDLKVTLVEHDEVSYDLMYNHVANPLLWFVQHGLYDLPYVPAFGDDTYRAWEDGYLPVNENFAKAVQRALETAGDMGASVILVHDYHLYMVPRFLRERLGDGPFISLFVHIPWPAPEGWRVLPKYVREGILWSLLQCDVVAFHTKAYARSFVRTVREVLGAEADEETGVIRYEGREVRARAYPISIDPDEFEELARSNAVLEQEEYVKGLPGMLLLRVDRMDLSKNIVRGFRAYGRMIERHPELKGEVTFFAGLQPSRGDIPEYAAYAEAVKQAAEEVNAGHGTDEWRPVILATEDNFPRAIAAYKNYDVLLVNAVRDGMNLVAKEAAVVNERNGVLILSEGAGAHEELGEHALTVNPFDVEETAEAIHRALTMGPEERARRAAGIRDQVRRHDVRAWISDQLVDLDRLAA